MVMIADHAEHERLTRAMEQARDDMPHDEYERLLQAAAAMGGDE
jgi:hypothetical protein